VVSLYDWSTHRRETGADVNDRLASIAAATYYLRPLSDDVDETPVSTWLRLRYGMETAFLHGLLFAVGLFPRRWVLKLAAGLGRLAYYVLPAERRVADANVRIVFGDTKTAEEKRAIARTALQTLARNLAALFWARRMSRENFRQYVHVDEPSWRWFQQVRSRGRGVIIVTPHYGDWEAGSLAAGFMGAPFKTVAESFKNRDAEALLARLRSTSGHTTIPPRHAVVKLFKALKRGETISLLVDVNGRRGRGGVWLDFFGLKVFNAAAVAHLAVRTGAAIVFAASYPLAGYRTRLVFGPEVEVVDTGDAEGDALAINQRCLDLCADLIRRDPYHWLWTYKRWKRRPTPDLGRYPHYSKYDETMQGRGGRAARRGAATMATAGPATPDSLPA
jgi:Kdo2-lipid IVA lauroyltransferase/acyltransferase